MNMLANVQKRAFQPFWGNGTVFVGKSVGVSMWDGREELVDHASGGRLTVQVNGRNVEWVVVVREDRRCAGVAKVLGCEPQVEKGGAA